MWPRWKRSCDQCKETQSLPPAHTQPTHPCSLLFPDFLPTPCSLQFPAPSSLSLHQTHPCSPAAEHGNHSPCKGAGLLCSQMSTFVLHWWPQDAHWGSGARRQSRTARSWLRPCAPSTRPPLARQPTGFRCTCRWCWAGRAFGCAQALWGGSGRSGAAALCRPRGTF